MRYATVIALVTFALVIPLKAQENDRLEPMLQYVIDLPEIAVLGLHPGFWDDNIEEWQQTI